MNKPDVALRPVRVEDLDLFQIALSDETGTGEFQWFGFTDMSNVRRAHAENGLLTPDGGTLAIDYGNELVGRVEWFASAWGRPSTSSCWTVAIGLLSTYRGAGIGTEAQRQLVDYLFAHTRCRRIQAFTDVENLAEQGALKSAGFVSEGILRSAQWRAGAFHDMALFSVIRGQADD